MKLQTAYFYVLVVCIFIAVYKRFFQKTDDKPHKPGIIIISILLLYFLFQSQRPFLLKHGEHIISITVILLVMVVLSDIYEVKHEPEEQDTQTVVIDTSGSVKYM